MLCLYFFLFFFFNDTATTEIYTLSLHDALPICLPRLRSRAVRAGREAPARRPRVATVGAAARATERARSEEHTSELQSRSDLVCRLLLEKKKNTRYAAGDVPDISADRAYHCRSR